MDKKNMELEKPIDKVTLLGIELQPKEEVNNKKETSHSQKKVSTEKKNSLSKEYINTEEKDSYSEEETNTAKSDFLSQEETNNKHKSFSPKEEKTIEKREFHPVENYHPENDRHLHSTGIRIFGFSILLFIILLCIAFLIFTFINNKNENIISGIHIKGVEVSGLSTEKAKETIQNYINENLPENINLVHNDYETSIPLSALNVSFDIDSAVNQAYEIGKSGNIFENSFTALKTWINPIDIELSANIR